MARDRNNSASILLMAATLSAGVSLIVFSSLSNRPPHPPESLHEQFDKQLIVAPGSISGENVSGGASSVLGPFRGRPYLLGDGHLAAHALGRGKLPRATIEPHFQGDRIYQGVFGPGEYYPRRLYFFIERGPQLLPIRLEEPLRKGLGEHLIVK